MIDTTNKAKLNEDSYELLFSKRPFRGRTNTALTNSILHEPLQWPEDAPEKCSAEGMQAVKGLLERDPNRRLGYRPGGGGLEDLKAHPWFKGIDWEGLKKKEVVPPFEPDVLFVLRLALSGKNSAELMHSPNAPILMLRTSWKSYCWKRTR